MENNYRVEIQTESGAIKRTILTTETRGQAYRVVTTWYPTAEVLSITKIN